MVKLSYNLNWHWAKRVKYALVSALCLFLLVSPVLHAGVPVTLYQSFAGNMHFQMTGATLRTLPDNPPTNDACQVVSPATTVNATLAGIPGGSTIQAAYLYWAGSYLPGTTPPDYTVTFQGATVNASRTFTETFTFGGTNYDFFSGFADVTGQVTGNGVYGLSGLTVHNAAPHCNVSAVLAGWSLVVVYQNASEPLRVVNVFDGFQYFRLSRVDLTPANFQIPAAGCGGGGDCKLGVISWEGDAGNSGSAGGFSESLYINPPPPPVALSIPGAPANPANNQYNSTVRIPDVAGPPNTGTAYGVDVDVYPLVTPTHLNPGDTSAVTRYESGNDLVLLSAEVFSVRNTPVADLSITKTHTGDFVAGQQGVYTITVSNSGPNDDTNTITVSDTLPTGLSYVSATGTSWTCGAVGQDVTCTHPGPLANGNSLPAITLTVNVAAAAAPSVTNSATVSSATFDNVAANNTANDLTNVLVPNLTSSTKTVVDLNGGDADPGDRLRYTITIIETGGAAVSGVSVTDVIGGLLENFTVTNNGGGTDGSTSGSGPLSITGLTVPANSSIEVEFEVDIVNSANPGDLINNTAAINNPVTSTSTDAVAPTILVSASSIPGSGLKQLYPTFNGPDYGGPSQLSRVVVTSQTRTNWLLGGGGSITASLTPALQAPMQLPASIIPVRMWMRRSNNGGNNRTVTVSLDTNTSVPTNLGSQTQVLNIAAGGGGWQVFTFAIDISGNHPAGVTLSAGTVISMTVTNNTGGNTNQRIRLSSLRSGTNSEVVLNSNTVINVDSMTVVNNTAYPGGTAYGSFAPEETVRVRAVVSDPFGHDDITSATIEILNPSSTPVVVAGTPMTEVAPLSPGSPGSLKTFEYVFAIPVAAPSGNWTARVTANEGTEGTISDLGTDTFLVGTPALEVEKVSRVYSDPVSNGSYPGPDLGVNPKAITGAIIEYEITVTNSGVGPANADSIVIDDALAAEISFFFNNPVNPIIFSESGSGLSFTFGGLADGSDDVDFSNDGGSTFITPSADASGFDTTVPLVNFIRIMPKGRLNGSIGSGDPSFSIIFRGRLE